MSSSDSDQLQPYQATGNFVQAIMSACFQLSASIHTRRAYWSDARQWLEFCDIRGVDPRRADPLAVAAWVETMRRDNSAPKTRARRITALASIYNRLRREDKLLRGPNGEQAINPFSVADGPAREKAVALNPTPIADPHAVQAAIDVCDDSPVGLRDVAIMRVLWATGTRCSSMTSMTFERLRREKTAYVGVVDAKGGKQLRVLVQGKAAEALDAWLAWLRAAGIDRGSIWRETNGAVLVEKDISKIVRRRAKQAGMPGALTPHTFRVAFLTFGTAELTAKQDAAGHADPATTRLYDRKWRGRSAFEQMPEVEDAIYDDDND
jgi:site-specific recombinase XerD